MIDHLWTALVTLLSLLVYLFMGVRVTQARAKHQVPAPAISGNPDFERVFRVHANTLEWLPPFLVSLWLFSAFVGDVWAAGIGAIWIIGRILYLAGYTRAAEAREVGFIIQAVATAVLLFGSLGRVIWLLCFPSPH